MCDEFVYINNKNNTASVNSVDIMIADIVRSFAECRCVLGCHQPSHQAD